MARPHEGHQLTIQLLGQFKVRVGSHTIPDAAWQPRAAQLVKLLTLAPGHRLHREQVLEELWPRSSVTTASNNLHQLLHTARGLLEPWRKPGQPSACLQLQGQLLTLSGAQGLWIDVEAFELACAIARTEQEPAAFEAALNLYTGELLPEDRYADWVERRRADLHRLYLAMLLELAGVYEARGERLQAIRALERAVAIEPAWEAAQAELIRLLAETGQRHRAARQYQDLRQALRRELDVEPEPGLQQLYGSILAGAPVREPPPTVDERPTSTATPTASGPTNLPSQLTSFVGREPELAELRLLLQRARRVTLTGAGGVGKSRLARQAAAEALPAFAGGVWLVDLAHLSDPALVPGTLAAALGLREEPNQTPEQVLIQTLGAARALLVLDNCEHLREACRELVGRLLARAPQLRVLATSRVPLGADGEVVWRVPSLSHPAAEDPRSPEALLEYDAVRLFLECARWSRPGFELTHATAPAVAQVCRRLAGIPLAVELAAARLRVLSVQQIAERLDDALGLLSLGSWAALPRHQTLKATFEWSHALLSPLERRLFRRLAVFAGGWTLEAAEAITAGADLDARDVLGALSGLVEQSLVVADERDGRRRYALLEPVRQYASLHLAEADEHSWLGERHRDWFLALAAEAEPALIGAQQAAWLERLEQEHANLRAALRWSLDHQAAEAALRLSGALWRFWWVRGYLSQGRQWLEAALALPGPAPSAVRANALNGAGVLAWSHGDLATARRLLGACVALRRQLGDRHALANALNNLGIVERDRGNLATATALFEECQALRRELGDQHGLAKAVANLGIVATIQQDYARARDLFGESLAVLSEVGGQEGTAYCLEGLATARAGSDPAAFDAAWAEGRGLAIETAVAEAWAVARDEVPRRAVGEAPSLLSRRECEVAGLIARGLTNREIARVLVTSTRTVDSHVSRILHKLGLTSRAQIAVWAVQHELPKIT